jgi:hypothetical protein
MVTQLVSARLDIVAETRAASRPEPGLDAECFDFTLHLARRLGLTAEQASHVLGEALLRYEPGELELRGVGASREPAPDAERPPRRSGVYPCPLREADCAALDRLG